MKTGLTLILLLLVQLESLVGQTLSFKQAADFAPRNYVVHKTRELMEVDGKLNEADWNAASWTDSFTNIRGSVAPNPRFDTRVKMLWDDNFLYIAALLEEPHVWATLTERDAVIFMDNNFEVFIDPNGDTHNYYELEVNALGTFWDLMLTHPYRNGGKAIDAWDIKGLKVGIDIKGTLNDPSDIDEGWTVELAIPWDVLEEASPEGKPSHGSQWRINFSRVEWQTDIVDGEYVKQKNPDTGENLPEENWSWSPQGLINMHYPEMWGFIQFSNEPVETNVIFERKLIDDYKWLMRVLYYRQIEHRSKTGGFAEKPHFLQFQELFSELFGDDTPQPELSISVMNRHYIMRLDVPELNQIIYIQSDSRVWAENR